MNETGNEARSVTSVLPKALIPQIIARRNTAGSSTPEGRRLSTLVEQLENGISPVQTLAELDQIRRDGGEYIHANHGAGR